ncbi:unnamed protein product [Cladocopium goreaui]|uniref:Crt-like 1 n=1 Tax=Cladocopium goreaui TaxID=2562237 RepID=A0A9P1M3D3_9DINO|nr:unnamed protein product [Cladocopium goreaui]
MFLHLPSSQCSLPNSCGLHWPRSRVPPLADRLSIKLRRLRVQRQAVDRRLPGSVNLPVLFVSAAVANRVSNRVLLAPLLHHTYFLALTTTVAQLVVYLTWLKRRCRKGLVQDLMWSFAKRNPALITAFGMCEGAFFPLVFYSAARLPGSLVQVLNQTLIPSTVLLSCLFLRRRYDILQITGVAVVLAGVAAFTSFPRTSGSVAVVALCIAAYGLQAGAMVLKEVVFSRYQKNPAGSCAGHANDGIGGDRCLPFDPALFLTAGTGCRLLVQFLAWPVFQQLTQGGLEHHRPVTCAEDFRCCHRPGQCRGTTFECPCFLPAAPTAGAAGVSLAICTEFSANCPWELALQSPVSERVIA